MAYTFTGDWFELEGFVFNVGHEQLETVNQMTYPNESKVTRSTDGETTNISDIEYYTQPSIKVGFNFISAEQYHLLMQLLHLKQTMTIKYYDPDFNKIVTHQMYAHPTELQNFFTRGQTVEGVRKLTLTFVATCKDREKYTITLLNKAGAVIRTYPNILWGRSILLEPQGDDSTEVYEYTFKDGVGVDHTIEFRSNERITVFENMTLKIKSTSVRYRIVTNATNITPDPTNPTEVDVYGSVDLFFTQKNGYALPNKSDITVTNAESFSWTPVTSTKNKLSITNITGDCTITIKGVLMRSSVRVKNAHEFESVSLSSESITSTQYSTITAIAPIGVKIDDITVDNGQIVSGSTVSHMLYHDTDLNEIKRLVSFKVEWATETNGGDITVNINNSGCNVVTLITARLSNASFYDGETTSSNKLPISSDQLSFNYDTTTAISIENDYFTIQLSNGYFFQQKPEWSGGDLLENFATSANGGMHWTFNVSGRCDISGMDKDGNNVGISSDNSIMTGYLAVFEISANIEGVYATLSGNVPFVNEAFVSHSTRRIVVNAFDGEEIFFDCTNGVVANIDLNNLTTDIEAYSGYSSGTFFIDDTSLGSGRATIGIEG